MNTPSPICAPIAEAALCGAVILDPEPTIVIAREIGLCPSDFYSEAHRIVYAASVRVYGEKGTCDPVLLIEALRASGALAAIGGEDAIVGFAETTPSIESTKHYAETVVITGRLRRLVNACESVAWKARQGTATLPECVTHMIGEIAKCSPHIGAKETQIGEAAASVVSRIKEEKPASYPFGFDEMDHQIGGIPRQGVVVIMGVPGSGKSSLALQLAMTVAKTGVGVRVFSYEMSAFSVAVNVLAASASVNVGAAIRTGRGVGEYEGPLLEEKVRELLALDFAVIDESLTADEIMERCRLHASKGVKCVIVDYVQNLPDGEEQNNDTRRVEHACRVMQRIARDMDMLVLLVSQMTGAAQREDRPPRKSDGLGSAAIDQVSDMTIGVYRPCVFNPRQADETAEAWQSRRRQCQLHILKNKQGPIGDADVVFMDQWTRFLDIEHGIQEGAPPSWTNSQPEKSKPLGASNRDDFWHASAQGQ